MPDIWTSEVSRTQTNLPHKVNRYQHQAHPFSSNEKDQLSSTFLSSGYGRLHQFMDRREGHQVFFNTTTPNSLISASFSPYSNHASVPDTLIQSYSLEVSRLQRNPDTPFTKCTTITNRIVRHIPRGTRKSKEQ